MKIEIGVSNRHVHLTKEDLDILFGENYELNKLKDLTQPGQYASIEKVDIKTDKNIIKELRILGPTRDYTQVELSKTDCYTLGIDAPVRTSGNLDGAAEIEIIGPNGSIKRKSAIIADRHIHITKEERLKLGLENINEVKVKINTEKGGILEHVKIKESEIAYYEMHIDTDDANAFLIKNGEIAEIILN